MLKGRVGKWLATSAWKARLPNVISTAWKKVLPSDHLLGNNYSCSTHLLVNMYSLQEMSTFIDIVWSVVSSYLTHLLPMYPFSTP